MRLAWALLATTLAAVWTLPASPNSSISLMQALSETVATRLSSPENQATLKQALSQGDGRNSALEQVVLDLLESARGLLQILDFLIIENVELDDSVIPLPGSLVALRNLNVAGLSAFQVDQLSINLVSILLRFRALLDISIPTLEISAEEYELQLSALGFNIYGAGSLKLKLVEPKISLDLLLGVSLSGGIYININECTAKIGLAGFEPEITGLFGHDGASDIVNLFLKDLVPVLVDFYEAEITEFLSEIVQEVGNSILADLDLSDLIPLQLGAPAIQSKKL